MIEPPDEDEIEITILGRGVGESVVVHVPDSGWVIVDSFRDEDGNPAALTYLNAIAVAHDAVDRLVITHFDRDHYVGAVDIYHACSKPRVYVSAALQAPYVQALRADDHAEAIFGEHIELMERAQADTRRGSAHPLVSLKAGMNVQSAAGVRVRALAPMEAVAQMSDADIIALVANGGDVEAVRLRLKRDNRCSVVLSVESPAGHALLGGDLERQPFLYGWEAVVDEPANHPLPRASLLKVPHHGSPTGDAPELWQVLLDPNPELLVAPMSSSRLPRPAGVKRLLNRGRLHQAAPSTSVKVDSTGAPLQPAGAVGSVTARRRPGESAWRVHVQPPAFSH